MLVTLERNRRNRTHAFALAGAAAVMSLVLGWFCHPVLLCLGLSPFIYWLSSAVAVQSLKRYLPNPHDEIRLHDLVMHEVEKAVSAFAPAQFPFDTPPTQQEFTKRISRYEAATEILQSLFATGCYWGNQTQISLWVRALQRLANPPMPGAGSYYEVWPHLGYYPSLLLFYAGGIAAVAAKKYEAFAALACFP